jgi:hypothetical protein
MKHENVTAAHHAHLANGQHQHARYHAAQAAKAYIEHHGKAIYMKTFLTLSAALFLSVAVASSGPKPQSGNILSNTSVACGTKKSKKQEIDLLCQQYVIRSGTTDYTVRQPKPSDQTLIPLNTTVQFTLNKNKMKFKANGESFEFVVISQAASSSAATTPAPSASNRQ